MGRGGTRAWRSIGCVFLRGLSVADSFKFKMNHQFFNRVLKESSETKHLVDNKAEEFRSKVGEHYVVKEAEPGHRRWRALIVPTPYDWEAYGHEKKHNALQKAVGAYPVASKSPKKGA
nr:MAG TPA: type I neck protein [Caudoviricetes sp.]